MSSIGHLARRLVVVGGVSLAAFGGCLPDGYLALSAQNVAVAVADGFLGLLVTPIFDALEPGTNGD